MTQAKSIGWVVPVAVTATLAVTLFPTSADAISRYTSTSMTCASIKSAVRNEGAVILGHTSPRTGNALYDRYVRNRNYCLVNQIAKTRSVPAADTKNCRVKYCVERRKFEIDDD